jgi:hypothetical protein
VQQGWYKQRLAISGLHVGIVVGAGGKGNTIAALVILVKFEAERCMDTKS